MPGSQLAFLESTVPEVLLEGPRGSGKTDVLLMDFTQHVGQGFGDAWTGILFRKTFKQLQDVVGKTRHWFRRIHPSAKFNSSDMHWKWPTGEILYLRYMDRDDDYENYHGSSYPWIGWEELTRWASDKCYRAMMSTWRSRSGAPPGIPKKYRATTNPMGCGHNWVRARFQLPVAPDRVIGDLIEKPKEPTRIAIHSHLGENIVLMASDPHYRTNIAAAARNPSELAAWLHGSWDIIAGGMFDDIWSPPYHVVPDFPLHALPRRWRVNRAYDHGQSKPFSVGWFARSNGEPLAFKGRHYGTVPGDIFHIAEWYGWSGRPNEGVRMLATDIARGIIEREADWGLCRVRPGPADISIFSDFEPGKSVAGDMKARSVKWVPADMKKGSRTLGWEQMRKLLAQAIPGRDGTRDEPGFFVCERCTQFRRTVPVLPRDEDNLDDVDTESEDHCLSPKTEVRTPQGDVSLQDLQGKNGFVMGPDGGWHWFHNVRITRRNAPLVKVTFDDGRDVVCTPDHEFLTMQGTWEKAEDLADMVCYNVQPCTSKSSAQRFKSLTENDSTSVDSISRSEANDCIVPYGNTTEGPSQQGCTSTTGTMTARTIKLETWHSSLPRNTLDIIPRSLGTVNGQLSLRRKKRSLGTRAQKGWRGISSISTNMSRESGTLEQSARIVRSADQHLSLPFQKKPLHDFARTHASQHSAERPELTMWKENAQLAIKCSESIDTRKPCRVRAVVPIGRSDVMCLTVPDVGCFVLANGAVVSNCGDMIRYRVREKSPVPMKSFDFSGDPMGRRRTNSWSF